MLWGKIVSKSFRKINNLGGYQIFQEKKTIALFFRLSIISSLDSTILDFWFQICIIWIMLKFILPLGSKKNREIWKTPRFCSHSKVTRGSVTHWQWFSRAPPHHTFPAFQNLNGRLFIFRSIVIFHFCINLKINLKKEWRVLILGV